MKNSNDNNRESNLRPSRLLAQCLDQLCHSVPPCVGRMVKHCGGPGLGLYLWIETGYSDKFLFIFEFFQINGRALLHIRPSPLICHTTSSSIVVILIRTYRNAIRKVSAKFCSYISNVLWKNTEVLLTKALFGK